MKKIKNHQFNKKCVKQNLNWKKKNYNLDPNKNDTKLRNKNYTNQDLLKL